MEGQWRLAATNTHLSSKHSGGSSRVGLQMVLSVLKTTTTRTKLKVIVVHSIADFNGEGQPM